MQSVGGGSDRTQGAKGVAGRIGTVLNAGDGNDRVQGTDALDRTTSATAATSPTRGTRRRTRCRATGIDLAFVDRRDLLRQCELGKVLGREKVSLERGRNRSIDLALNQRGRRFLSTVTA